MCDPWLVESAYEWKQYYCAERERLGSETLEALLGGARPLDVDPTGAVIVPHTRFEVTGGQIASAVTTVLASGADRVLALGVLHGGRRSDRGRVEAARSGNTDALAELRGVHDEDGLASEEFSLDAFVELLDRAAERVGRSVDVIRRYPFLVGADPATLPGLAELEGLVADGVALVATTDPIHHGHAYGTPSTECAASALGETRSDARAAIDDQLAALSDHRFEDFAVLTEIHKSDFRDTGPVLAHLLGSGFESTVHDLELVDYSAALDAPAPTWVAGALVTACTAA